MDNPFQFSGVVDEPSFCNRQKELNELTSYIEASQNILLFSHRRYGKSSLILKVFKNLKSIKPIYVDLYGTTSIEDFVSAFLSGISKLESKTQQIINLFRQSISSIKINYSIDPLTGVPTAAPVFNRDLENKTIEELFTLVKEYSKKSKLVIAFDEFQEVSGYGGVAFEKLLRKFIQTHNRVSYIFAGSQRDLLVEMFSSNKRAFFKQAVSYPLGKIKSEHYIGWITNLYKSAKRKIELPMVNDILNRCSNHPRYVQEFFYHSWTITGLNFDEIEKIERRILESRIPEFSYIWDVLTLNQKRALKLIAGTGGKNMFSARHLDKYGFRTASQVTATLKAVEKSGLVTKNDKWHIDDPFFERWLLRNKP